MLTLDEQKRVLEAYNNYEEREFRSPSQESLPSDGILYVCYTTYEFDEESKYTHDIQINFNLNTMCWENYIDDELVLTQQSDVESLIDSLGASFDDIIWDCVDKGFELEEQGHFEEWKKTIMED